MGERVEVGVLGPVLVRVDGATVRVPSLPQRILLARLALADGRMVPVSDLVRRLWVGEPPANANGNLHGYVSKLRQIVGREAVVREASGYRLALAVDQIDLGRARGGAGRAGRVACPGTARRGAPS